MPALAFVIGFAGALALQATFSADFAGFVNSNFAQYVALFIALVVTRTLRSISVENAARRLLTRSWAVLAALAHRHHPPDLVDLAAELVDRLGLLTPKLATRDSLSGLSGVDALGDLRIAMTLALVQQSQGDFTPAQEQAVHETLTQVGKRFAALSAGRSPPPSDDLLRALDHSLTLVTTIHDTTKRTGVAALVGLRRNLFPQASPPTCDLPPHTCPRRHHDP